jgi:hypothetical protein
MSPITAVAAEAPMASTAASSSVLRRPVMNTCAPSAASRTALARPIPVLPPVTTRSCLKQSQPQSHVNSLL